MPYKSKAQQGYMHAKHPEVAKKWDREMKDKHEPFPKKEHVSDSHHSPDGEIDHEKVKSDLARQHAEHVKKNGY